MTHKFDIGRMRVASPCHVGWDSMIGDDRARLCASCDRHVYNIIGLSRGEIQSLVDRTEGRVCVRMYQRPDATVLTDDCPVGIRLLRKRAAAFAGAAFSTLLSLVSLGYSQNPTASSTTDFKIERVKTTSGWSEISGTVIDPTGAVIPGTSVTLRGKGFNRRTTTDGNGKFRFESVAPDVRYILSIESTGFANFLITDLDAAGNESLRIDVRLQSSKSEPYAPVEQKLTPLHPDVTTISSSILMPVSDECKPGINSVRRTRIDSAKGEISGLITDEMGAVVPGITLRLFREKIVVAIATSDSDGKFVMRDLTPAEDYVLRLADSPWKKQAVKGLKVNGGEKIESTVCLQPDGRHIVVGLFTDALEEVKADTTSPETRLQIRKP